MANETSVIEKRGEWYVCYIEEIPGVNTQGKTVEEVQENLKEALALIIQANRKLASKSTQNPDANGEIQSMPSNEVKGRKSKIKNL